MIVQYSAAAIADLRRVREFLRDVDLNLGDRAVATILTVADTLADFPFRAPVIAGSGDRRLTVPFGRAAYLVDYRVYPSVETVAILRVRHSREARWGL